MKPDSIFKILIVDDDAFNREGMRLYLERLGFSILEAGDETAAWNAIVANIPEVVVLDIVIPPDPDTRLNLNQSVGVRLARRIKQVYPSMGIVLFSAYEDRGSDVWEIIHDGGRGMVYKLKGCQPAALFMAIHEARAGRVLIDPEVLANPHSLSEELVKRLTVEERPWVEHVSARLGLLTAGEREIVNWVAAAHTTEGIAQNLGITAEAVENYIIAIYAKLGLSELAGQSTTLRQSTVLAKACLLNDLRTGG
ncbi:MAG: response regulator transcription factor [Chloroflexi bacterium]|nr:response regulator transcription factor [Chloroflexota bacterium]MCI0649970.1 response regulator transcription factor [Chloroflexota bacterium]MCI0725767.1 response regulator transcription factor [Chloroflexota bacterium]